MLLGLQRPSKPLRDENGVKVRNKMERSLMLPLRYIFAHTKKGDWVVDLFGGYIPPLFCFSFHFYLFFSFPVFFSGTYTTAQACLRADRKIFTCEPDKVGALSQCVFIGL
jgi:hypothetical protein